MSATLPDFQPLPASTKALAATDATGNVQVRLGTQPSLQQKWYLITNTAAADTAWIEVGTTNAVAAVIPVGATPGSMPVLPLHTIGINGSYGDWVAAICATGKTASLYITVGHI